MRVIADVQKSFAGSSANGRARGIIRLVERHLARLDEDEHGPGMAMPSAVRSGLKDDALNRDVERWLRLDLEMPVVRDAFQLEHRIVRVPKPRAREESRLRRPQGEQRSLRFEVPSVWGDGGRAVATCEDGDGQRQSADLVSAGQEHGGLPRPSMGGGTTRLSHALTGSYVGAADAGRWVVHCG